MSRKCENWIETFMEWTLSRSVAPQSVLFICALYTLASVVRRQVKIPKTNKNGEPILGGWECYPHIYTVIVADPGVITKSTTIGFVEDLLDQVPGVTRAPESLTTPILYERLKDSPDTTCTVIIPEFGTVLEKAGLSMYTALTNLFDGKKRFEEETVGRGIVLVNNPCVNMLGATTPDWIQSNMSMNILSGGFGSRTLWIKEDKPRVYVLIHRLRKDKPDKLINYEQLERDLVHDLIHISENSFGEFEITQEGQQFIENWYQELVKMKLGGKFRIKGLIQRSPAYVFKFAMLGKLAKSDELILDVPDLAWAIDELNTIYSRSLDAFRAMGKNEYALTMESIIDYVRNEKSVKRSQLLRDFNAEAAPAKMGELIDGLVAAMLIQIDWTDARDPSVIYIGTD